MIERAEEVPGLSAAAVKAVSRFHETLDLLRARVESGSPVAEVLQAVLSETGYLEALGGGTDGRGRGEGGDLEELVGVAAEFDVNREQEGDSEIPPLEEFLQQISLVSDQDSIEEKQELITLMTLHNAKGLEYDTVFVVGCEDGAFPHMRALEEGGEEEERRLCYVAITRARRRLYMTWARERRLFGRAEHNLPSRFIDELPAELTERQPRPPRWDDLERAGAGPIRPSRSTRARRWRCGPATTSSTPASATASSPGSSPVGSWSSASPPMAPSAS